MNIYTSDIPKPYVYICIHKITEKIYIGYREYNVKLKLTSDIDFPLYRTSSKIVNPNFNDYYWYIVAEFNNGNDAYEVEQQLIFEHWNNPLLINQYCDHSHKRRWKPVKDVWNKGITYTKEQKEKQNISGLAKGQGWNRGLKNSQIPWNKDTTGLQEAWNKGKFGEQATWFGKKHTQESRLKMCKPKEKIECPTCKKIGGISQMKRWHFKNCKHRAAAK